MRLSRLIKNDQFPTQPQPCNLIATQRNLLQNVAIHLAPSVSQFPTKREPSDPSTTSPKIEAPCCDGLSWTLPSMIAFPIANRIKRHPFAAQPTLVCHARRVAAMIFDTRKSSLDRQQSKLQDQQAALDLHVTKLTETLTAKYNAMDSLVARLKASASSITSFFDSLNAHRNA